MAAPKTQAQKGTQKVRRYEGQIVKSVLYNGRACGHGRYFAAEINGQLVLDPAGRPIEYRTLGTLE